METFVVIACAVFGLLIGSFLNACAYRIPRHISIAKGRSVCPHCGTQIKGYDNIPLLSYAILRGHCRACGAGIHWRYPLVEGLTGALFAAVAAVDGLTPVLGLHLLFVAALILVSDIDLQVRIIPDVVVLPVAAIGLVGMIAIYPERWWVWPVAGFGAAVSLLAVSLIYEKLRKAEGMGMGDVKLALCMGFYLGASVVPALFVGFVAGAVAGIVVMARGGSAKSAIPFGPFLAAGAIAALFLGPAAIDWYLGFLTPS
jgi:leader peptidase (prepilin peptidase) / N-methyltransferase